MARPRFPARRESWLHLKRKKTRKIRKLLAVSALSLCVDLLESGVEKFYVRHQPNLIHMPSVEFRNAFRLRSHDDFLRLYRSLRLPETVYCSNGSKVSGRHALAIVLKRLTYANRLKDCMRMMGRESTQLSRIFNTTLSLLYSTHGHLLESLNQPWLSLPHVQRYVDAVHDASNGRYDNCFGFIDGTCRAVCKPTGNHKKPFYSGYYRGHVTKFQSIVAPDGLIINMCGPFEGRRHDSYMLGQSQLRNRLQLRYAQWGQNFCLFGDKGYSLSQEVQVPYKGPNLTDAQLSFNLDMSRCRMAVELGFQRIATQFAFGNYRQNQKIYWQQCGKAYLISALLANCITCLYGFQLIKNKFNIDPPDLETYLRSN